MIPTIISALATVAVAVIGAVSTRDRRRSEERAALRERESRLSMQMISATMELTFANTNALCGGHNNGNVQAAKEKAEKAREAYEAFLQEVAAHAVAK